MTKTLNADDLRQFTGTETWYRHALNPNILYTDGARHVAEAGEAYWLLDEIVTGQGLRTIAAEEFQVWKLTVHNGNNATLTVGDGNDKHIAIKSIEFTDFPLPEITFWLENNVIMLPSER